LDKFNILLNLMRKLKYILASVVLAAGFASCETEPIDEKVKDDTLFVKPILRFELDNKQTVVTEKVTSSISPNNSITISARFSVFDSNDLNEETRYKPATLNITFNTLYTGTFQQYIRLIHRYFFIQVLHYL